MVRSQSNTNPTIGESHKLARAAVLALQNALAASRQHPDTAEVWRPARRRAIELLDQSTQLGPLTLGLRAGSVYVDAEAVLNFHWDEPPFGPLRRAGIGELVLAQTLGRDRLEQLLDQLSAMAASGDVDGELTALIDTSRIPGVELRAAVDIPAAGDDGRNDWHALPAPRKSCAAVRAMIERDCKSNLPALAARQLFDDLEHLDPPSETIPAPAASSGQILPRLMERVLEADDIATAIWLLTELERRPQFDARAKAKLLAMAQQHCSVAWLQKNLDRGCAEDLLQVSALAMQLGDDIAERFAHAAAAVAHPLSQWLGKLLGYPSIDSPENL